MKRFGTAVMAAAAVVSLGSACGNEDGPVTLSIDGRRYEVDGPVSCSSHSGGFAISAGEQPRDVFIRLLPGGLRQVGEVYLGGFDGFPLRYDGKDDGSDLTVDGMTYTIAGNAEEDVTPSPAPPSLPAPTSVRTKSFTLVITCPSEE